MSERLLSVGLDVGTTSTQMVVSELTVENRASSFMVPEMDITRREIRYKSPVHFTPLLDESRMDARALRTLIQEEYRRAGINREQVDTGAIIITGETSRKENARAVLEALSDLAGEFVVTAAGPDLESVLAARGAGAVALSEKTGERVLHVDIGGGTSNLCLIRAGKIERTGCLNVGGRLIKLDETGRITYLSPVLSGLCTLKVGEMPTKGALEEVAGMLTRALEMAAGRIPAGTLLEELSTREAGAVWIPPEGEVTVSFSGGVADCIEREQPMLAFGDLGPLLGQAIRESSLCRGRYVLGAETIRATVIGAGCHTTQLSGSTVYAQNIPFPLKNVPVAGSEVMKTQEGPVMLALPGNPGATYAQVASLAEGLMKQQAAQHRQEIMVCLEKDLAKALGQALAARMGPEAKILCIDGIRAGEGSFLDIAAPVGGAFPVVVKTLVFGAGDA